MEKIMMNADDLFAVGGNRCCFVHPEQRDVCLKVNRPDRSPEKKRSEANWFKRLRPLSKYDENANEILVMCSLEKSHPQAVGDLIPRCDGWVETNYGAALKFTLYRNEDGEISPSLEAELMNRGMTKELEKAIDCFVEKWVSLQVPSRQLLLHNIVVVKGLEGIRLIVIDGLGHSEALPLSRLLPVLTRKQITRKIQNFRKRLETFQKACQDPDSRSVHWAKYRSEPLSDALKNKILGLDATEE